MPQTYRVKIVRGNDQFEAEGDRLFVLDMLNRFEGRAETSQHPAGPKAPRRGEAKRSLEKIVPGKPMALSEFIRQLGVRRHTDIVLGFGYYLEKHSELKEFTAADINNCYYEAKLESSNTSQMIAQNIKRGTMMSAKVGKGSKRKYTLTQSGEQKVESLLAKAE